MSYSMIYIIYLSIAIISILSIIIGIINIVRISLTSAAVNELQDEIEKKVHEFENLKKESASYKKSPLEPILQQALVSEKNLQHVQTTISGYNNPQIEIVRNLREGPGMMEDAKAPVLDTPVQVRENNSFETIPQKSMPAIDSPDSLSEKPSSMSDTAYPRDISAHENFSDLNTARPYYKTGGKEEVIDIVSDQAEEISRIKIPSVTLPLFSQATKDADFKMLWNQMIPILEAAGRHHINIDFGNILFLYDKEIEYLHTIFNTVKIRQHTLSFIHCSHELHKILDKDPVLRNLIQEA